MADDIDDLLDEIESKLSAKSLVKPKKYSSDTIIVKSRPHSQQTIPCSSQYEKDIGIYQNFSPSSKNFNTSLCKKKADDDLNSLIEDICSISDEKVTSQTEVNPKSSKSSGLKSKCFPVFLGGSFCARGLSSSSVNRSCDNLRCLDCDFKVLFFDNFEWHSSTDYIFLRNNMPDTIKLTSNLVPKKGSRAYSCQCKWQSVQQVIELQPSSDLKWVCGKH